MPSRHTVVFAALLAAGIAAGCSGGGGGAVAPAGTTSNPLSPKVNVTSTPTPSPTPTPTADPTPSGGTLYYGGTASVYAIPLTSNGATTASRTITPHPNQPNRSLTGIATNADGTLDIQENYWTVATPAPSPSPSATPTQITQCQTVVEAADANGSPGATNVACDPSSTGWQNGDGVARNAIGGFDQVYDLRYLKHYQADGATLQSTLDLIGYGPWTLATDAGGHDYIANNQGGIYKYQASATSSSDHVASCTVNAPNGDGPIAVAPDKTIYIFVKTTDPSPANVNANGQIDAITSCGTSGAAATVSRVIGPFGNFYVTGLAVDKEGELYVALSPITNTGAGVIRVYSSFANGKPTPLRIITPTNPSLTLIYRLAIFE